MPEIVVQRLRVFLIAMMLALAGLPADAGERRQVTVNEAVRQVEQRYGGRVVNVQTVRTERGVVYRIRILDREGRVRTVTVPAER